ncbi:MAG: flagellar biosynthesis protein FlhB [Gammaproteobacteria bacterium]
MAEHDDAEDRTEQPTDKRLHDARQKGQVVRSRELATVFVLFGGALALRMGGPRLVESLADVMTASLRLSHAEIFAGQLLPARLLEVLVRGLLACSPVLAVGALVALAGPLALGGWNFTLEAAAPKLSRLDPLAGMKRVFGTHGWIEMLKALAKFGLVAAFAFAALRQQWPLMLGLSQRSLEDSLAASIDVIYLVFLVACAATVVIAFIDVPLQLWQHGKQLRMSRQEIREEMKETDGSPEMKGRIRAMQHEVARRRMMAEVPKADVVITNPTHYAVALKFKPDSMRAPILVAKGVETVAFNIRELAEQHGVTVMSAPPLARAIYHTTKLNREIPAGLYVAVARVLAYVFQLRAGNLSVTLPSDLPIPDELKH